MKFLCDQCKAKYQIADEKVQGKTLRMKCRKCGHVIEIRAITGDTKPSSLPPPGQPSSGATMQVDSLSDEAAAAALANPTIPQAPKNPFAARPAAGAPAKPSPPRPTTGTGAGVPRPTGLGGGLLGGRADATGPRAPLAASPTGPRPLGANKPEPPKKPAVEEDDNGPPSALANAFNRSVAKKPEITNPSSSASTDPPAEEWYVAIDEVPIGPIRLTDLRAKYGAGNVTDDSLVWREGFEEWRPLRTLAELHELVREEVSQPRGSIMPGAPSKGGAQRNAAVTPRPSAASHRGTTPSPTSMGARPSGGGAGGGNVIPFQRQQGVAARKFEEDEDEVTRISSSPFFPPAAPKATESPGSAAAMAKAGIAPTPAPRIVEDPFAGMPANPSPVPSTSPTGTSPASAAVIARPPSGHPDFSTTQERHTMMERLSGRVQGISKGVVALIAAGALLLGVVIAVLIVKRMTVVQERVVEKQVEVPVSVFVPVPGGSTAPTPTVEPSASSTVKVASKGTGGAAPTTSAAPTATATTTGKKWGLGDEPAVPTDTATVANNNTGALDGKAVGEVAQRNSVGVRKVCYEKLVETGPADAKVNVHIRPDGTVSQVDLMSGSPSTFAACVQKLAYNWKFPTSGSGGAYPIPFIFK